MNGGGAVGVPYFGDFSSYDDMVEEFRIPAEKRPDPSLVLFAAYGGEMYEGEAVVVFTDGEGRLFLVEGSHCSCYGLEDQWEPDETTAAALGAMRLSPRDFEPETIAAFYSLFPRQGVEEP